MSSVFFVFGFSVVVEVCVEGFVDGQYIGVVTGKHV